MASLLRWTPTDPDIPESAKDPVELAWPPMRREGAPTRGLPRPDGIERRWSTTSPAAARH